MAVHKESGISRAPKAAVFRGLRAVSLGQHCPRHCPPPPGPLAGQERPFLPPSRPSLGEPLSIRQVAKLIGCSPWTVRQTLLPRGLPHFRFKASGRLVFYRDQVIRWIERQQQGG